jgi:hypothetical protein
MECGPASMAGAKVEREARVRLQHVGTWSLACILLVFLCCSTQLTLVAGTYGPECMCQAGPSGLACHCYDTWKLIQCTHSAYLHCHVRVRAYNGLIWHGGTVHSV